MKAIIYRRTSVWYHSHSRHFKSNRICKAIKILPLDLASSDF
jgi:hypothetical protein